MKSLPGRYTPTDRLCRTQLTLIDFESAWRAAIKVHGNAWGAQYQKTNLRRAARTSGSASRPSYQEVRDGQCWNSRRFMAIIRTPWWNRNTDSSIRVFIALDVRGNMGADHCTRDGNSQQNKSTSTSNSVEKSETVFIASHETLMMFCMWHTLYNVSL